MRPTLRDGLVTWVLKQLDWLHDGLTDPRRAKPLAAAVLVTVLLIYCAFGVVSNASTDVHWDIGELVAWSRDLAWGYKHPPMSAWFAAAWFAVLPVTDWAAFLLAMVVSGLAVWIAWCVIVEWLPPARWSLALAMLLLIPLHTFHALKFNANTIMMPFWAAASLWFLRSISRRRAAPSLLTGLAGAGAMLGKYWSVNLIGGLGLAALIDRRRGAFLRSAAPWLVIAGLVAAFAPHIQWLITKGDVASGFSQSILSANNGASRARSFEYVFGSIAYLSVPLLLFASLRPNRATLRDTFAPQDDNRRLIVLALVLPFLLPAILNLLMPARLTSLWTIPNWTLLPVVLLGSPMLSGARRVVTRTALGLALGIPVLALAAAPWIAVSSHASGRRALQAQGRQLGEAISQQWHRQTSAPLRWIGGDADIMYTAAFYAPDAPRVMERIVLNRPTHDRIAQEGLAAVCRAEQASCLATLDSLRIRHRAFLAETTLARTYRGVVGPAQRYVMLFAPPGAQ
jgi:hypothetical protein